MNAWEGLSQGAEVFRYERSTGRVTERVEGATVGRVARTSAALASRRTAALQLTAAERAARREALTTAGRTARESGHAEEAISLFEEALAYCEDGVARPLGPSKTEPRGASTSGTSQRVEGSLEQTGSAVTTPHIQQIIRNNSEHLLLSMELGKCLWALGRAGACTRVCDLVLAQRAEPAALVLRARCHWARGDGARCRADCRAALALCAGALRADPRCAVSAALLTETAELHKRVLEEEDNARDARTRLARRLWGDAAGRSSALGAQGGSAQDRQVSLGITAALNKVAAVMQTHGLNAMEHLWTGVTTLWQCCVVQPLQAYAEAARAPPRRVANVQAGAMLTDACVSPINLRHTSTLPGIVEGPPAEGEALEGDSTKEGALEGDRVPAGDFHVRRASKQFHTHDEVTPKNKTSHEMTPKNRLAEEIASQNHTSPRDTPQAGSPLENSPTTNDLSRQPLNIVSPQIQTPILSLPPQRHDSRTDVHGDLGDRPYTELPHASPHQHPHTRAAAPPPAPPLSVHIAESAEGSPRPEQISPRDIFSPLGRPGAALPLAGGALTVPLDISGHRASPGSALSPPVNASLQGGLHDGGLNTPPSAPPAAAPKQAKTHKSYMSGLTERDASFSLSLSGSFQEYQPEHVHTPQAVAADPLQSLLAKPDKSLAYEPLAIPPAAE